MPNIDDWARPDIVSRVASLSERTKALEADSIEHRDGIKKNSERIGAIELSLERQTTSMSVRMDRLDERMTSIDSVIRDAVWYLKVLVALVFSVVLIQIGGAESQISKFVLLVIKAFLG